MNSDLASLAGKPKILRVDGKDWALHPMTVEDLAELQSWLESAAPDPFTIAHEQINSGRFTTEQGKFMLRVAMEMAAKGKPKIGSEEADLLLQSTDGSKEIIFLTLRRGDPTITREIAGKLHRRLTEVQAAAMLEASGLQQAGIVGLAESDDPNLHGSGIETSAPESGIPSTSGNFITT